MQDLARWTANRERLVEEYQRKEDAIAARETRSSHSASEILCADEMCLKPVGDTPRICTYHPLCRDCLWLQIKKAIKDRKSQGECKYCPTIPKFNVRALRAELREARR